MHAVVCRWLDDAADDPDVYGHHAPVKKYSLTPLTFEPSGSPGSPRMAVLMVRLLDDRLEPRLVAAVSSGVLVELGRLGQASVAGDPVKVRHEDWPELVRWSGQRQWEVKFDSPAVFRSRSRTSPWPAPEVMLRGLADRWTHVIGQSPARPDPAVARSMWVMDVDGGGR
ncbi:MAG TPA: hypothetical protein VIJ23_00790, partial [Mycobacterium sp.]